MRVPNRTKRRLVMLAGADGKYLVRIELEIFEFRENRALGLSVFRPGTLLSNGSLGNLGYATL